MADFDPLLALRLDFEVALLEQQLAIQKALEKALRVWLPVAREALFHMTAAVVPDPEDVSMTAEIWTQAVEDAVKPAIGAVFDTGLAVAIPELVELELVPVQTMRDAFWEEVQSRIESIPTDVYALITEQINAAMDGGTSIPDLEKKLAKLLSIAGLAGNTYAIARTEATAAYNAGEFGGWLYADELTGEKSDKVWIATRDTRTRRTHRIADEQRVPLTQPFLVGTSQLMYPGWPGGPADEVILCRCAMINLGEDQPFPDVDRKPWPTPFTAALQPARAYFHQPGKHDQRSHGKRGLPVGTDVVPPASPQGTTADKAATWHRDLDDLGPLVSAIDSGVKARALLGGGNSGAVVHWLEYANGKQAVRKSEPPDEEGKFPKTDKEQLSSALGRALGAPVPRVIRTGDGEMVMEYVDGETGFALLREHQFDDRWMQAEIGSMAATDAGKRLGLLDLLLENTDRHEGNWLQTANGPVGIDHGHVKLGDPWEGTDVRVPPSELPEKLAFARTFVTDLTQYGYTTEQSKWAPNDLSPDDVTWVRARLDDMKDDFEVLERGDWWKYASERFEVIAAHASGKRNLFAPETASATFHLPGQHDQRDHGRRGIRLGDPSVDDGQPQGGAADQAAKWHRDLDDLGDLVYGVSSPPKATQQLSDGPLATVVRAVFSNDKQGVLKKMKDHPSGDVELSAVRQADAEQLASLLGRFLGAPVPRALRVAPDTVAMDAIPGETGAQLATRSSTQAGYDKQLAQASATGPARRLAVLDLLLGNGERGNPGNWLLTPSGTIAGVDHAGSWSRWAGDAAKPPQPEELSPFATGYVVSAPEPEAGRRPRKEDRFEWADNDLTPADVQWMRTRLDDLKDDFAVLGRQAWWKFASQRLDALGAHAKGGTNLFAPVTAAGHIDDHYRYGEPAPTPHPWPANREPLRRSQEALLGLIAGIAQFHLPGQHDQKKHGGGGLPGLDVIATATAQQAGDSIDDLFNGPDRIATANKIVGGTYHGLTARVDQADEPYEGDNDNETVVQISGKIYDADGRDVGDFRAQVILTEGEDPFITNAGLRVDREVQGSGFALEWNAHLFDWAQRNGVGAIGITANEDVGGYAWASQGWEFSGPSEAERMIDWFVDEGRREVESARASGDGGPELDRLAVEVEDIASRAAKSNYGDVAYPTPRELSQAGRMPGQGGKGARWFGKSFMLGKKWEAGMFLK